MNLRSPNSLWKDRPVQERSRFLAAMRALGFAQVHVVDEGSAEYDALNLAHCFTPGLCYVRGHFWLCPSKVSVEDFAHDVGHAFLIPPSDRNHFAQAESDIDTHEAGAMVIQWALLRAMDATYPVGRSLQEFGYGFGGTSFFDEAAGENWQGRLEKGVVIAAEAPAFLALRERGLVPPARFVYVSQKEDPYEKDWAWDHFESEIKKLPVTQDPDEVPSLDPVIPTPSGDRRRRAPR